MARIPSPPVRVSSSSSASASLEGTPAATSAPKRTRRRAHPTGVPRLSMRIGGNPTVACQRCYHRKKKCDHARPECGACHRAGVECVYDIPVTDSSHPTFVANLLSTNAVQRETIDSQSDEIKSQCDRIAALEARLRDLEVGSATSRSATPPVSNAATFAERAVRKILINENETGFSFTYAIGRHLGVPEAGPSTAESKDKDTPTPSKITAYPPKELAEQFVNLFFDYTISFYPIHDRQEIQDDIDDIYSRDQPPTPQTMAAPDYRVYRLFLMLAGGCTLFEARHGCGVTDTSESLCNYAMEHFPAVFRGDDLQCLTGLTTFVNYSVLHFGRVSQYIASGVASRFALEIGLHKEEAGSYTTPEQQQRRRRLFWSVYNLDRLVSAALNQPATIPEELINTPLPTHIHTATPLLGYLSPVDYFAVVVAGRRVSGILADAVYITPVGDAREVQRKIHALVDDWYASIPRDEAGGVLPFFELCYHALQVNIYRPSPLSPATEASLIPILRHHAYAGVRLQTTLTGQGCDAVNTLQFLCLINLAATLIYTIIEADGEPRNLDSAAWRNEALTHIAEVEGFVAKYGEHSPGGARFNLAFSSCANQARTKLVASSSPSSTAWTAQPSGAGNVHATGEQSHASAHVGCNDPLCCAMSKANGTGPCEGCGQAQNQAAFTAPPAFEPGPQPYFQPSPAVDAPAAQSTALPRELWETWAAPALIGEQNLGLAVAGIGMDELFANVGLDLYGPVLGAPLL